MNTRSKEFKSKKYRNITLDGIIGFLSACCKKIGLVRFVKLILEKNFEEINNVILIADFCEELTYEQVNNNTRDVSKESRGVVTLIIKEILRLGEEDIIKHFNNDYIREVEKLTLEFNVESKSSANKNKKTDFRKVNTLSQGQKVVAMLSFVMGYTTFQNDVRPLIIDQPEDNLDNRYIYKILVESILEEKIDTPHG